MKPSLPSRRYASEFRCIGAECEDTCCGGWPVEVDDKTKRKYLRAYDLKDTMRPTADGTTVMCHDTNDKCVKLEGGLCGIQKKYGADYLSDTCYHYPRSFRQFGEHLVMHAALSCPEVARGALFGEDAFALTHQPAPARPPKELYDFLLKGMDADEAIHINQMVLDAVLNPVHTPERHMARLLGLSETLEELEPMHWLSATHFYLNNPDKPLPAPVHHPDDPVNLFRALHRMLVSDRNQYQKRIYATLRDMEAALEIRVHWGDATVSDVSRAPAAWVRMQESWAQHGKALAPLLHRWLAAEVTHMVFPFTGMSVSPKTRAAVLALHFATVRLALMAACHVKGGVIDEAQQLRIIQSISRTVDHTIEQTPFFRAYNQPDWHHENRLRALIGDTE
ncbi:MAG: hypothetical protein FJX23_04200 [Alphaproteobacteria bacterium]|nr:hypothetical protein [Alphaproteobacteria bacterium]